MHLPASLGIECGHGKHHRHQASLGQTLCALCVGGLLGLEATSLVNPERYVDGISVVSVHRD